MHTPLCRIEMLGHLGVRIGSRDVSHFRTRKAAELLAYIAYYSDRAHPREVLIELLWPECDVDSGRHNLSMALSSIRQELGSTSEPSAVLATDRFTVALVHGACSTDVAEFDSALSAAESAPAEPERISCLSRAADLYRGDLLPGFYNDWILPEQQRLEERYLRAVLSLIGLLEASGDVSSALDRAQSAVARLPMREETHAEVIRLYMRSGQQAAALRMYQHLERVLQKEMETEPSPGTKALLESNRAPASPNAREAPRSPQLEPVGGALPIGSRYYIVREQDAAFEAAIDRRDSIVLVKGARQVGKSSLLARGLARARDSGARVVLTHFQLFNESHFESPHSLLKAVADSIAEQLALPWRADEKWDERAGANPNFRRFISRSALGDGLGSLVWGLDEADRVMSSAFGSEVFGLFRSWHDERALDPSGPWTNLTLAIAYSTEPYLFIRDVNQSPFNVGIRVFLEDLSHQQVAELNTRYGSPLKSDAEVGSLMELVGGQPYLVQRALYELASKSGGIELLGLRTASDEGIFGDHLRRVRALISREQEAVEAVLELIRSGAKPDPELFHRLRSAGILTGDSVHEAEFRCRLYADYLKRHLA